MTTRKIYTKEYKLDSVSLVRDQNYNRSEAARNLGINANNRLHSTLGYMSPDNYEKQLIEIKEAA